MQTFEAGREGGQTMTEYSVVLAVITIACLTAIGLLSESIAATFERVANLFG
jgi:Flp pilus assembly pilin Flp